MLDMLVQRRRDSRAALRLMRKLLKKQGFAPNLLVTDKLRSYASTFRPLGLGCPHEQGLRQNNRAENSHQAVRRRERNLQAVQVGSIRPAVSEHACRRPQYLQSSTPSHLPIVATEVPCRGYGAMADCSRGRMTFWSNQALGAHTQSLP
ncbi:MAG: IS6 family transposase [Alphaproteobacteria bacterium]|nr:IS6 family transposase [Alphaproteobacteria bacterium]